MIKDRIKLSKKAGGSIIDHRPIFSANSKILYVGCGHILQLFSTETGEHIQDIEFGAITCDKPEGNIIDIALHPFDKNIILTCFDEGRVITWSFETNSVISNLVLDTEGCRVVRMQLYVVNEEYETFNLIVACKSDRNSVQIRIYCYSTGILKTMICRDFDFLMHSWSVTKPKGEDFLAGISYNQLFIYNLQRNKLNKGIMIGNERYFTCVACHPVQECVAAGDNTGRVILYYDFLEESNASPHFIYHWHHLAVNDISFSPSGSIFFTGGNEHVLVKWTIDSPDVRHFLPRLSAPIVHIVSSADNQYVAISTLDNGIMIVDAQYQIRCSLQKFTWGFVSVPGQKLFPCGLTLDPRTNCIVMNGKPGHIQFYSPQYSSLIYNMDIVGQNYITQERIKSITNAEVVAIDFSFDGVWLATSQFRDDPDYQSDTFFKFWQFERKSQSYKLMSCITLQHNISKIQFQPIIAADETENDYFAVTLCSDCKFRFWISNYSTKKPGKTSTWTCHSIGYYNELPLNDICFSGDGSVLGAAFGPCLTVWDTETNNIKCSLTKGTKNIEQVVFGHGDCSFIAIASTEGTLYAWNLLSLTLMWSLDLNTSFIIADPRSEFVAAFTDDNSLYVFRASSSEHVYKKDNVCEGDNDVLSVTFSPAMNKIDHQDNDSSCHWLCNSSLYFFTSTQELMAFEYQGNETVSEGLAFISEKAPVTPFQALVAGQSSSDIKKNEIMSHLKLGMSWTQTVSQFVHSPAHAMPPVHLLSETLLKSLIINKQA